MEQSEKNLSNQALDIYEEKTTADQFSALIDRKSYFGWSLDKEKSDKRVSKKRNNNHFLKKRKIVFTRPKEIVFYDKLIELEKKYEALEKEKKEYNKADPINAFFLFLLCIIPGIIYVIVKSSKKKSIKKKNAEVYHKQESLVVEAQNILQEAKIPYKPINAKVQYGKKKFQNPYIKSNEGVDNKNAVKPSSTNTTITNIKDGDKK